MKRGRAICRRILQAPSTRPSFALLPVFPSLGGATAIGIIVDKVENRLMRALPRSDRQSLVAACQRVDLILGDVLLEPGEDTSFAYFPVVGFISLVKTVEGSPSVEVGMVGREGMVGVQLALGVPSAPLRALVQGSGIALRLKAHELQAQLSSSRELRGTINRYIYVLMSQLATSAACLRNHSIGPRLARWLLMTQDRAGADQFRVTQEFLAYMLGVRREGVTAAARSLQVHGLIRYVRGELRVLNRAGLEAAACPCYALDQLTHKQILGNAAS